MININLLSILLFILFVGVIIFIFNSKYIVDDFAMDYSCEAVQNKYYHTDELLHKSQCPNIVILEKSIGNRPVFFAEYGDHNGPYFSKDYIRYYYMGMSPDGIALNLDYDLYYYPWYNPYRWFYGSYGYYPRRDLKWRRKLYNKWDDYSRRLERRRHGGYNRDYRRDRRDRKDRRSGKRESRSPKRESPKRESPKRK